MEGARWGGRQMTDGGVTHVVNVERKGELVARIMDSFFAFLQGLLYVHYIWLGGVHHLTAKPIQQAKEKLRK
jgi:hypothetical protein